MEQLSTQLKAIYLFISFICYYFVFNKKQRNKIMIKEKGIKMTSGMEIPYCTILKLFVLFAGLITTKRY